MGEQLGRHADMVDEHYAVPGGEGEGGGAALELWLAF